MLHFIFGMIVGGAFGVCFMCLLQINHSEWTDTPAAQADFEKSISGGVDNPTEKG